MIYFTMTLKWGKILIRITDSAAISGLWFWNQKYFPKLPEDTSIIELNTKAYESVELNVETLQGHRLDESTINLLNKIVMEFRGYESGTLDQFDLPLELSGTAFQLKVWNILQTISLGETTTYGRISEQLAKALGKERMSAQAVGGAVGRNPISIVIPCHRVLGSQGQLTGYAGGVEIKEALLIHEGAIER